LIFNFLRRLEKTRLTTEIREREKKRPNLDYEEKSSFGAPVSFMNMFNLNVFSLLYLQLGTGQDLNILVYQSGSIRSCMYVMFHKFRTIIFFSQDSPAPGTFEVDPSFSQVINNCPPLFRTNTRTSHLEPRARVLQTSATQSIAALSIVSSDDHPC
jgi:hypothetical protein